ncbi:OB-fold domain-containing protein [Pigmentiphaga soli]|uniref:OB-fold domain-containing protein n=1 Tax=Pigmentiphaga soli TaxID=1007095 RepID=A0ABP8HH35_9BURK
MSTPAPRETAAGPELRYRRRLAEGVFEIQRCGDCGRHVFYPRVGCSHCGSAALAWVRPSGRGTVYSTTVVRARPEEGGPYNVAIVELAEGPRLMSRVEGIAPAEVRIGLPVRAAVRGSGGDALLVFLPDTSAAGIAAPDGSSTEAAHD